MLRFFRFTDVSELEATGPLNNDYRFFIDFEYNPGEPFKLRDGRIDIRLGFENALIVAEGNDIERRIGKVVVRNRMAWLASHKLIDLLVSPTTDLRYALIPTDDEVRRLLEIDPLRVEYGNWVQLPEIIIENENRIFISCGQRTDEEKELGQLIAKLVYEITGLEGYFADFQTSMEGLTENIFNALHTATGFISVMHRRDKLSIDKEQYRGSVWVEQEIAIASFIVQTLGKTLHARSYIQNGIIREGVRGFIILNPIEFSDHDDIIKDLRDWLPSLVETSNQKES